MQKRFPLTRLTATLFARLKTAFSPDPCRPPLKGPLRLAAVSTDVIEGILNLDVAAARSEEFLRYASGGALMVGSEPLAHRYGGHQFGYWAGQLGDGRAHTLGQFTNRNGEVWELQLKGSGKTPYSRFDSCPETVAPSSVREFLCSEAMHFLGVPTSRAARSDPGRTWLVAGMMRLSHLFSRLFQSDRERRAGVEGPVLRWKRVCNTDNFSLLSVTIDYGPFGFVESYDPSFVPNASDDEGRYSIGAQAGVGHFNLGKLLAALRPVLTGEQQKEAQSVLNGYADVYQRRILQLFRAKLGLLGEEEDDGFLIALLLKVRPASRPPLVRSDRCWCLQLMEDTRSDFTLTFRQLSEASAEQLHDSKLHAGEARRDLWRRSLLLTLVSASDSGSLTDVGS
ncbi:hypothetical protein fugu_016138 [Takifugu bimaculatus]|uniref:Selenoprotein O n=1 Tax=Takifugu bimaculatus TaxID=433685 RepID=A0A4Z2BX67_9TELE|nr:hypothetical protein fugu_016138 [Takifugu bimaculatus]